MKVIKFKITYGIHILLNLYNILLTISNDIEINMCINIKELKQNRNDVCGNYLNNYFLLVNEIFSSLKNVKITNNDINKHAEYSNIPYNKDWIDKILNKKWENVVIKNNNHFTKYNCNSNIANNYICINTKIVNSSEKFNKSKNPNYDFIKKYNLIKEKLFEVINNLNYKVVVLGERYIPDCNEYNFHKNNYGNYLMYDDLKKNICKLVDETYEDSKDGYEIFNWKKTCYYLTHSKFNIYIGNGGGIHLYSLFSNCVQLGVSDRLLSWIPKENIETNYFDTIDTDIFINKIKASYDE